MNQVKKLLAGLAFLLASAPAFAVPVIGGQLFASGGAVEVTVEVMPATAGYTSELWLYEPGTDVFIAYNYQVGVTVNLGTFAAGTELVFGIHVLDTGNTFLMGPGFRNTDGLAHAAVDVTGLNQAVVGFEDLLGGGDLDYDDNVFRFTGVLSQVVPEPGPLMLIGLALAGLAVARRVRN